MSQELIKNEKNLDLVLYSVESDFEEKQHFYRLLNSKDTFIMKILGAKFDELETRRENVVHATTVLQSLNRKLLKEVEQEENIKEGGQVFRNIEIFADDKVRLMGSLRSQCESYERASEEFAKIAFFTKMVSF